MTSENADAFEMSIGMPDNTIKEMRRVSFEKTSLKTVKQCWLLFTSTKIQYII